MPDVNTTPYDTAETVLQFARGMANDAALSLSGDILSDSQPYIFSNLQSCYRDLQARLRESGFETQEKYWTVTGLTAVTSADPATQVQLMYNGYYDGTNVIAAPTLPSDLLEPLYIWERQNGSTFAWKPLKQASASISTRAQTSSFSIWDWKNDILFLPGATQKNDLKIKGLFMAPAITGATSQILITDAANALAALLVEFMADARGGDSSKITLRAERYIKQIINRGNRKNQYATFVRQPFRGRRRWRG